MEQQTFLERLTDVLTQAYVWEKQHPKELLKEYKIINLVQNGEKIIQILTLQRNENYGFVIYSFIKPDHPVWLSPIGMMFGKGNCFEENGEQTLICPPDSQYIANLVKNIICTVYGTTDYIQIECE